MIPVYTLLSVLFLCLAVGRGSPAYAEGAMPEPAHPIEDDQIGKPRRPAKGKQESFGNEIKKFGEEVASRVDKVVRKNSFLLWGDPWTIQGIPLLFPSSATGFNMGLRLLLNDMRRSDPHQFEVEAQALSSDRGRYKYFVKLDFPHAFNGKFRITTRVSYDRDISFPYFGVGNDTVVDEAALAADTVLYQNVRAGPSFSLLFLRNLGKLRIGPMLGLRWTSISAPLGSLLERDRPVGLNGGRTHFVGLAAVYDGLDFEPYPTKGDFHEVFLEFHNRFTASDYEYYRGTYTYRNYHRLNAETVLGLRLLFEALAGDVPYYELGAVGGSNSTIGFGGDKFLRGYRSNRFVDYLKLVLGVELRWDPLLFEFAGEEITLGLVPFIDAGRVWPKVFPLTVTGMHVSAGWGARLAWNKRFIIRSDFAVTQEGSAAYFELGHSF